MFFSLLSKSYDPVFPLKTIFPLPGHPPYLPRAGQEITREGGGDPLLALEEVALWTIRSSSGLITRETERGCEADGQEQKAILV